MTNLIRKIPRRFSFPDKASATAFVEEVIVNHLCNKVTVRIYEDTHEGMAFVTTNVLAPGIDRLDDAADRNSGQFVGFRPFFWFSRYA